MAELKDFEKVEVVHEEADFVIIGAGNAGCFAAIEAKKINPDADVLLVEKANIVRSGCLAAGMDVINTYIKKDKTPEDYLRWSRSQAGGLLREDLALKVGALLNEPIEEWERWGLPIKKDEKTEDYKSRGKWDITIRGEAMKPILAEKVAEYGCRVINRVVATDYILDDKGSVAGVVGFGVRDGKMYVIRGKAVCVATGGAAGVYKSYTSDSSDSHHQLWYSPYNTGAGYAMGIRAGAEMTLFEMRWCATRTKDFNGPIDTISVGYGTPMINASGEKILQKNYAEFGGETSPRYIRANAPMDEWREGRGPCFMDTRKLNDSDIGDLKMDYLNERPSYVLFLASRGQDLKEDPIEIYGNDPYIVGGHTASGYWLDSSNWQTTLPGLFACGDVAGGVPNKFVGGCAAEGMLAARGAMEYISSYEEGVIVPDFEESQAEKIYAPLRRYQSGEEGILPDEMEERLQRLMDEYAGGIYQFFRMNEVQLKYAERHLAMLKDQTKYLVASDYHELMRAHEVIDLIDVSRVLVAHLLFRKETRWAGWQTRTDYPNKSDEFDCFVNSVYDAEADEVKVFKRDYEQIVPGDRLRP